MMSKRFKLFIVRVGGFSVLYAAIIFFGKIYFPDQLGWVIIFTIIGVLLFASARK